MKPRAIEVHIEELILHGFDPGTRWNLADALEDELRALLATKGIPPAWQENAEQIDGGSIRAHNLTKPAEAGAQIAGAVYGGGTR